MILSATSIKQAVENGDLTIIPFSEIQIKGASYTFTLNTTLRFLKKEEDHVEVGEKREYDEVVMSSDGYVLEPGAFVLAETKERLSLNNRYGCTLSSRGSCAQAGLAILLSSTFAEPDTDNTLILEIANVGGRSIKLVPGMKIVKGIFSKII